MKNLSLALADTILARHPDPLTIPYRKWCYVHGYVLAGFEKLYQLTGNPKYFEYIRRYAEAQVTPDGEVPAFTGESLDDMMAGTAIVAVFQKTREARYQRAAERIRRSFDDYPRNADGGFWHARNLPHEMWIDGVFMGQMFLTRYGTVIGDREACFNEAVQQIGVVADRLAKGDSGLYLHGYDEARAVSWADKVTGLSSEVWSEGLGWYALVLTETLALMDPEHPGRERVQAILRRLVEELARVQDPRTGLWYQVVDKGKRADNWHDTSGSAMFVYAIQRAIELGCVSPLVYRPVAERGYAGILTKASLGADGLVDIHDACDGVCVQNSYHDYVNYKRVVNAKEAIGSVLWASTIIETQGPRQDD
jgi:rhamnogalacturonyl hydrolase YesR